MESDFKTNIYHVYAYKLGPNRVNSLQIYQMLVHQNFQGNKKWNVEECSELKAEARAKKVVGTCILWFHTVSFVTCQHKLANVPFTRMTISNSLCFLLHFICLSSSYLGMCAWYSLSLSLLTTLLNSNYSFNLLPTSSRFCSPLPIYNMPFIFCSFFKVYVKVCMEVMSVNHAWCMVRIMIS